MALFLRLGTVQSSAAGFGLSPSSPQHCHSACPCSSGSCSARQVSCEGIVLNCFLNCFWQQKVWTFWLTSLAFGQLSGQLCHGCHAALQCGSAKLPWSWTVTLPGPGVQVIAIAFLNLWTAFSKYSLIGRHIIDWGYFFIIYKIRGYKTVSIWLDWWTGLLLCSNIRFFFVHIRVVIVSSHGPSRELLSLLGLNHAFGFGVFLRLLVWLY